MHIERRTAVEGEWRDQSVNSSSLSSLRLAGVELSDQSRWQCSGWIAVVWSSWTAVPARFGVAFPYLSTRGALFSGAIESVGVRVLGLRLIANGTFFGAMLWCFWSVHPSLFPQVKVIALLVARFVLLDFCFVDLPESSAWISVKVDSFWDRLTVRMLGLQLQAPLYWGILGNCRPNRQEKT